MIKRVSFVKLAALFLGQALTFSAVHAQPTASAEELATTVDDG